MSTVLSFAILLEIPVLGKAIDDIGINQRGLSFIQSLLVQHQNVLIRLFQQ